MNSRPNCQARIRGDQYHCDRCGLVWDIKDQDPPDCRTVFIVASSRTRPFKDKKIIIESNPDVEKKEIEKIREILKK